MRLTRWALAILGLASIGIAVTASAQALQRTDEIRPPLAPHARSAKQGRAEAAAVAGAGWITWGNGLERQSRATTTDLFARAVGSLKKAWSRPVDDIVNAQPLYLRNIAIRGARRDIYIVATENGSVYAFDARTGKKLWRRSVGRDTKVCPGWTPPDGDFGVTSTPMYDAIRKQLYVAVSTRLLALDVKTGNPRPGWPVQFAFNPLKEHVFGAVAQLGRYAYVATASACNDSRPFKGRLFRVDVEARDVKEWDPVTVTDPLNGGGGMWGWGGVAVAPSSGHVWALTGNAESDIDSKDEGLGDAESVVELDPELVRLHADKPGGVPRSGDYDFGATPLLFEPRGCPPLVAGNNKVGKTYLWRRSSLEDGPYQRIKVSQPPAFFGTPAWDPVRQQLYVTTTGEIPKGGLVALRKSDDCTFSVRWRVPLGGFLNSVPTVSNDVVFVGVADGSLRAFSARTGDELWRGKVGSKPLFASPIVVGRDVAIAGWDRRLTVYRLPR